MTTERIVVRLPLALSVAARVMRAVSTEYPSARVDLAASGPELVILVDPDERPPA